MSPLRDLLLAPRAAEDAPDAALDARDEAARDGSARDGSARSLGLLAPTRELPAIAAAAGLALAGGAAAALVCVREPSARPALAAPPRGAAARLVASLHARGLAAHGRGRIVVVGVSGEGDGDADEFAVQVARALAAAGGLPTVLAVAGRDEDADALLAARDGILVALGASASAELTRLVIAGAARLGPPAAALTVALDPVQRALALAGVRAPRTVREAVEGLIG